MKEPREIEIRSRADTLQPRPWPVTPPPSREDVAKIYARRKAEEFGTSMEDIVGFEHIHGKAEALQGLKVLDVGIWRMGNSFASSLLGELGAEVVKIEPPGGDPLRELTPFGRDEYKLADADSGEPCGLDFISEMRNKYSVTLDLESAEGRAIYRKMADLADIIIENYPPGQFDEWGIGYRQVSKSNPRVIYAWVGVLGQWGPMKDKVSKFGQWMLDPFGQAACSFIHNTGFPQDLLPRGGGGDPTRSGVWISDYVAGEQATVDILAALYHRDEVSGRGQFVEVTGAEALMDVLDFDITWYGFNGSIKGRTGGWDPNLNQYAWNPCKDGYMMIGGQTDRLWYRINQCIERELPQFGRLIGEDPFLKEIAARNAFEALTKTYTLTTMWLRDNTRAQTEKKLMAYDVAAGPVMTIDEVTEFPHFKYRPWVSRIEDEHYGTLMYAVPPTGFQHRTPGRVKWMGRPLGKDNPEIYGRYLGLGNEHLAELKEKGVI